MAKLTSEMGLEILEALGLEAGKVYAVTIHFEVNEASTVTVKGYETDEKGRIMLDEEANDVLRYVRRFRLVPLEEGES